MALSKPVTLAGSSQPLSEKAFAESIVPTLFPTLWSYLADATWSDGSARSTSTLTLFVEDGLVKLCLNDRELKRTCWSTGGTLEASAEALESRLAADNADWRGVKPQAARNRR